MSVSTGGPLNKDQGMSYLKMRITILDAGNLRAIFLLLALLCCTSSGYAMVEVVSGVYCQVASVCTPDSCTRSYYGCVDTNGTSSGSGGSGTIPVSGGSGTPTVAVTINIDGHPVQVALDRKSVTDRSLSCSDEVDVVSRSANAVDVLTPGDPTGLGWGVTVKMYGGDSWSFKKLCNTCSGVARWAPTGQCTSGRGSSL